MDNVLRFERSKYARALDRQRRRGEEQEKTPFSPAIPISVPVAFLDRRTRITITSSNGESAYEFGLVARDDSLVPTPHDVAEALMNEEPVALRLEDQRTGDAVTVIYTDGKGSGLSIVQTFRFTDDQGWTRVDNITSFRAGDGPRSD